MFSFMVPLFFLTVYSYTELMDTKKSLCSGKHSICVWNWPAFVFWRLVWNESVLFVC
jgi:hypothetical protein